MAQLRSQLTERTNELRVRATERTNELRLKAAERAAAKLVELKVQAKELSQRWNALSGYEQIERLKGSVTKLGMCSSLIIHYLSSMCEED